MRDARLLAYLIDMSRILRSVRLAPHLAHLFNQRLLKTIANKILNIKIMATPDLSKLKIDRTGKQPGESTRKRRKPWLKIGIAVAVACVIGIGLFMRFGGNKTLETATIVKTYPSRNFTLLNATGYVVAQRKAAISSKASGRLEWLGVLEGSEVKKDEIIARLENRDVRASLNQAIANVQVARANLKQGLAEQEDAKKAYDRSSELLAKRFISTASHDAAQARLNQANAAISGYRAAIAAAQANQQAAQVAFDQTIIRAPFNGVILTKNADVGDNITPFSSAADSKGAVVTMADMETLEVEVDVSESSLHKIKVDQPCEIQLDALPDKRLAGVVSRMVPTLDRSKATLLVKVSFTERDPRLLPDMSAKVAFLSKELAPEEKIPQITAPPKAIIKRNGKHVLFVVIDGKARQTEVSVGEKIGEQIAVQGVQPGDKVALNPGSLKDGATVKPNTK